jgi:hypothetical protein
MNNITDFEIPKTADGKVYLLRSCAADMTGRAGFKWPETGPVEAPTEWWGNESDKPDDLTLGWDPCVECGAGLHGLLWGIGDFSLMKVSAPQNAKWLIVEALASDTAQISRKKAKISRGNVVFCGSLGDAVIRMAALRLTIEGDYAPASTTGDYAPASTTGYHSTTAPASTTGYSAPASTTGDYAPASTTGYYAPASTTGNSAPASTTGYYAPASTTGNSAPASTTGYCAPASTTGNSAPASTTGYYAPASTTGDHAPASTTGYSTTAPASTTGNSAPASTTSYYAPASTTGDSAPASTTGYYAPASTTGDYAPASTTGENSIAASLGGNMARAGEKGVVIIKWWDAEAQRPRVAVGYVGENGISAGTWYRVESGVLSVVPANDQPAL